MSSRKHRLAVLDPGNPGRDRPHMGSSNTIGEEEKHQVLEVLESGVLSGFLAEPGPLFLGGPKVRQLEDEICNYFGCRYAVLFNSATSALHAAVAAAGVRTCDEVITSPYSMSASATCVVMQGGVPVFADVDPQTFCIDPAEVGRNVNERTRAVIPVHLYGQPADLDGIAAAAPGTVIIEDNAQAAGARYRGRLAGTIGHIGVLSFNRHKAIQCGEGGAALTDDEDLAMKMRLVRNHGEAVVGEWTDLSQVEQYDDTVGWNYRPTEMQAAVGLAQMRKLDRLNAHRQEIAHYLDEHLAQFDFIERPVIGAGRTHVYYFYAMRFLAARLGLRRDTVVRAVRAEGLDARGGHYRPIYLLPLFQRRPRSFHGVRCAGYSGSVDYGRGTCPVAERLYFEEVMLTKIVQYPTPIDEAQRFVDVIETISDSVTELRELEDRAVGGE